jgi:hypothetical protein
MTSQAKSEKVLVMLTMRTPDGKEWTVGETTHALDDSIEMLIRGSLMLKFLKVVRDSGEVCVP